MKASVVPSMKKNPYRVVVEFSLQSDILRAACMCSAGLGLIGKGKCNHVGGVLFAIEDYKDMASLSHAHHGCLCGLYPTTKVLQLNLPTKC